MKKYIMITLMMFLAFKIYSYDFLEIDKGYYNYDEEVLIYNHNLYTNDLNDYSRYKLIEKENIYIDEYGYINYSEVYDRITFEIILIPSEKVFSSFRKSVFEKEEYKKEYHEKFPSYSDWPAYLNIINISSSSYLKEIINNKEIEYKPEYLLGKYTGACVCHPFEFNTFGTPWVEGVDGNGVGEYLNVEFEEEINNVTILNGYVDPYKKHLFYQNNRLHKIEIVSEEPSFRIDYIFEDFVYYADILMPSETKQIKIIIKEVYPGTKYNDTCISGIVARSTRVGHLSESQIYALEDSIR